ncbi:Polyketide cyclase / dehydrase and lipid transport [Planctomycetes bacterium Pla163]|uniref:Polyketide cyclase / dehydrase and lipid transport n=1 Tax=Rohdeia mirabilis TaxID=2528008 RepID=A0A518CW32_9BACT|nr:Polyketide cyclase / dehydrase and lipid transport [Planctomycetes bacterium Pla163]
MRIVAITVLGLFLLLNLAGALVDSHTEVERELVTSAELDPARLAELTGDLARWPEWAPAFQEGAGYELEIQPGERTAGENGSVTLVFDGQHAILLMIAAFDPAGSIVVEARMGAVGDDLIGGEGFKAWDRIEWEPAPDGGTRLRWSRSGQELDLFLQRLWDRFVVVPSIREQLDLGLAQLAEAAAAPAQEAEAAREERASPSDAASEGSSSWAGSSDSSTDDSR